ncbi:hypothetical protein BBK82_21345 [Lentzea guizhouensis]|uniref:3-keto-5-aminohexanoate cleavage protein n=1 Tax=Lentzea guizhouensis TaxID=1586287 RepID=A0A1B2HKJ6_9PSEU|nr:3-keto-5-aminohexanoate cleavage protein [Lentzea guizhouensis]ANZ38233.1 hypothetical protein BBK82_21345 [Lentzea guizhouensis]
MLQACLNGSRTAQEHPALPLSPERLAEDAADVAALGVTSVHFHPRDVIGAPTLVGPEVATTIATVRAAVPGIEIGVSTDVDGSRTTLVASWAPLATGRPDIASVRAGAPGWREVVEALHRVNVAVELVVDSPAAAQLVRDVERVARLRVTATRANVAELLAHVEPLNRPILLHGRDDEAWPLLDHAGRLEHSTRMGLADTLELPDGRTAKNNVELVAMARKSLRTKAPQ